MSTIAQVSHPYLFFSSADIPAIRARATTTGTPPNAIWNLIYNKQSLYYLGSNPTQEISRAKEIANNLNSYKIYENAYSLALGYVIETDPIRKAKFLTQVRRVLFGDSPNGVTGILNMPFPNTCADHSWHGSTRIIALCLVYDLLYNEITQTERDQIKNVIVSDVYHTGACQIGPRTLIYDPYVHLPGTNMFAVWSQAIGIAAITLMGDPAYPEASADLDFVKRRLLTDSDSYLKRNFYDGGGIEGVGYAFWGLDKLVFFMYVLSRWENVDYFNVPDIKNLMKMITEWFAYEVLPSPRDPESRYFNDINDSWRGFYNQNGFLTPLLVLEGKYQDGMSQWVFENTIQSIPFLLTGSALDWNRSSVTPLLFTALLTYNGSTSINPSTRLGKTRLFKERGLLYVRTSDNWASYEDIQFAVENHALINPTTGIFSKGHNQSDKNHFTLIAFGQDFIVDQGYTSAANSSAEHNYILIDGRGQANNPWELSNNQYYALPSGGSLSLASSNSIDFIHGDAKHAFNFLYAHGWECPGSPMPLYCLKDASDQNYEPYVNTVDNADRFVNFIRSTNGLPDYFIICDDIQKDQNIHNYTWRTHSFGSATLGNPAIISGNRNSQNKLYMYYYDIAANTISPSSTQSLVSNQNDIETSYQVPEQNQSITRIDFTKSNVTNPYFHFLLLPFKTGLSLPTSVASISVTNGSILKSIWSGYEDYSIFKQSGSITSSLVNTDAKLSMVRVNTSTSLPIMYSMGKGSQMTFNGLELVNLYGSTASVAYSDGTIEINGTVNYFRVYAPDALIVKLNGSEIGFVQVGNYVESNNVTVNRTWSGNIFTNYSVTVSPSNTLTIGPASTFKLGHDVSFTVNGKLIAKGTPTQRITFTSSSATPLPGDWGSIVFLGGGPDTLTYCNIKYAENGLRFFNTAPASLVDNCIIDSCSIGGISISGLSNNSKVVTIRSSTISNNRERGISISNALADIKHTSIINNGNYVVGPGLTVSFARVYLSNSRIENNLGTGIIITGQGSNVIFSPDGTAPGYNFVTSHGVGEINIRNNGYAYIGQRYQYICRWDCDGIVELTTLNSSPDAIEPGPCRPIYCWANMAGLNNIYNNYNYFRRLINNETGNTIYAQNTYWGNSSGPNPAQDFYGNVVYIPFLTSPASTSAPMVPEQPIEEELAVTYIRSIEDNSTNALDALYGLESLSDLGVNLNTNIKMPWENFLNRIERRANSVKLKNLASAFRIKDKMRRKDFSSAISLSDVYLQNNSNDGMWMYYQVQKIFANIGNGDINTAESIYNIIKSRAYSIDSISTLAIGEIVSMLGTNNLNLSKSSTSDKLKIEKENSISPSSFILHQNYPNPFNPSTIINYQLTINNYTTLKIYDVLGREVATLVDEYKEAGYYEVNWDAVNVPTGVYLYKLNSGNFTDVKKLVLLK